MSTEGIEAVFVETHNWGKATKFFTELGFRLEFETDHNSGQLRNGPGPYIFVAEVPADRPTSLQVVLRVPDEAGFHPGPGTEVVESWHDTHYNTRELIVRDPEGRLWTLQAPGSVGADDD
jgi:hypothetical protein